MTTARRLTSPVNPSELQSVTKTGINRRPEVKGSSSRSSSDRSTERDRQRGHHRYGKPEAKDRETKDHGHRHGSSSHGHGSGSHGHSSSSGSKQERRSPTVTSSLTTGDSTKQGGQFKTPLLYIRLFQIEHVKTHDREKSYNQQVIR